MANEQNLKPIRTESEAREKGHNGGIASGESRRKKKLLKDCMLDLLDLPISDNKKAQQLNKIGLDPEDINNRSLLTYALFTKALTGDVNAFKEIRNLIGEEKAVKKTGSLKELLEEYEKI